MKKMTERKGYCKPDMKVVYLQSRTHLLAGSLMYDTKNAKEMDEGEFD